MIWLTWRQHRKQALFTAVGLALLAALLVPTRLRMHDAMDGSGLADCLSKLGSAELVSHNDCQKLSTQFSNQFTAMPFVSVLFVALPLLVGLFFGAPLIAREVEHDTHRFVWTQGVSRRQWAPAKFGMIGAATTLLAVVYALGVSWWAEPLATMGNERFTYIIFDVQGIAPIGYTLFAVALGIFAGTVCRKVMPAMGITLGGFLVARIGIELLARIHYMAPRELVYAVTGNLQPNPSLSNWVSSLGGRDAGGKLVLSGSQTGCPPVGTKAAPGMPDADACLNQMGLGRGAYNWQRYQPGDRFWAFQGIETGIFVALAALLLYLAVRRISRVA
ncbi:ABC transporter permease subunit [Streptomyces sp. SPB162]|uniref:ABC transporter permease n=1 Tax=Streptomyces sp. SPB162 TaxID=2940560 RepID=UPI002404ECA2|nr:ABC transporter permease subunit [Streptomyces sp. SPB162]MDF9811096.1 ABC-type transport system involved in multi-copper enzyme maturation permease subunit [Streptomyces sp. SPB162]